ncbi:MAG: MBL fold metallo-hydrolase [Gemmatimonadetes bacterium]|nr:MBL fold metallo-hydrolase [Gemmatimonadota bacterium]
MVARSRSVKLTFLGTGTSFGVPVVGCGCRVCTSSDSRDQRTRHGALLSFAEGRNVLIDTPPELRLQLLREGVDRVDAVWFTHVHADHLHGIDDLRIFSLRGGRSVVAYVSEEARPVLERRFDYIFDPVNIPERGTSKPQIGLRTVGRGRPERVAGELFTPLDAPHGQNRVMGFRVGELGYITDAKKLPPATIDLLQGVRVLVLNALWWGDPHPTHFNVEEAVATASLVGAERTFLTHLTHRVSHAELERALPPGVSPAYDGLALDVPSGETVTPSDLSHPRERSE